MSERRFVSAVFQGQKTNRETERHPKKRKDDIFFNMLPNAEKKTLKAKEFVKCVAKHSRKCGDVTLIRTTAMSPDGNCS